MAALALAHSLNRWRKYLRGRLRLTSLSVCVLLATLDLSAQSVSAPEYQVKAVFMFNFAQFADWPERAFADSLSPLVIGVLGDDPFGTYLDETVRGERVDNRSLTVRRYRRVQEIDTCHLLFISDSESQRLPEIISALNGRTMLTVSDDGGPKWRDVMIRFSHVRNKIRLKINVEATKAADITISSKLLKLAEIVKPDEEQ